MRPSLATRRAIRREVQRQLATAYRGSFPIPTHRTVADVDEDLPLKMTPGVAWLPGSNADGSCDRCGAALGVPCLDSCPYFVAMINGTEPVPAKTEYPGACGTAREAPTALSSGSAKRDIVGALSEGAATSAVPQEGEAAQSAPAPSPPTPHPEAIKLAETIDTLRAEIGSRPKARPAIERKADVAAANKRWLEARERERDDAVDRYLAGRTIDRRPEAFSRDPCARCGIRGDIGCDHQKPLQSTTLERPA